MGIAYNSRNHMAVLQRDGATIATYSYYAGSERIAKMVGNITTRYAYDESKALESEISGTAGRDYILVAGVPMAVIDQSSGGTSYAYVSADGLGSPRAVSSSSGVVTWTWAYARNPFGEQQPNSNGFLSNLRFPGQYFDAESGLNYNVNRDYEPATGRYIQSDPMGLRVGVSTFAYVSSNPLRDVDRYGLAVGIPDPNGIVPGDPWTPAGPGQTPGSFFGPKPPAGGPRTQCEYVPKGGNGRLSIPDPYWKTKAPGEDWNRFTESGQP